MRMASLGKNFWLFVTGRFVSQFGWAVQDVAIPLYVLDQTQSGSMMSIFVLAEMLPFALLPFAGVLSDRYNRKHMMVGFDLIRGAILLAVIAFNFLAIDQLLLITIILSFMGAFFGAATNALFPELVPEKELERANSVSSTFNIIAMLVGPAMGGLLYGIGGIMLPVLVNGLSFFGSGLFELFIHYEWKTKKISNAKEIMTDLKEGLRFLRKSKYLLVLMTFALSLNALGQPLGAILLPYVIREVLKFSSLQFGLIESTFMAGAIVGNMVIALKLVKKPAKYIFHSLVINGIILLVFIWLISPMSSLSVTMAFLTLAIISVILGSAEAFMNVPLEAKIQRAVPNELRGRVLSIFIVMVNVLTPLGILVIGPLLDLYPAWLIATGMWFIMGIVVLYFWAKHRNELTTEPQTKDAKEDTELSKNEKSSI